VKVPLGFDPREHDYGPATASVRSLLTTWADIDWFEPPATNDSDAIEIFREHNARAHAASPELVPECVDISVVHGQWPEFEAWCRRVREQQSWRWKYDVLKQLSHDHTDALGWSFRAWGLSMPWPSRPGDLVHRTRDAKGEEYVAWSHVGQDFWIGGPDGRFYIIYAHGDLLDAIQWQLAEGHDDRSNNPFDALVRCYQAGVYPFALDRSTVVLFRWTS
jgi:hypothetical protein